MERLDREFILHTYNRNYVNFTCGEGAKLYDDKGDEYIDFTSGIGVVSVGHANRELSDAICKQAREIMHISNLYMIEPQAILAKRAVELSGYDMRIFFANSGAEANEAAIKIARKYGEVNKKPKRYKIITLKNSFHGRTISTLKATAQESMHNYFGPYPDGFVYADSLEDIYTKLDSHTIGVMLELVQGEGGVEPLEREEVKKLQEELKRRDILLIIDEVQTGVYRCGEFLASNLYGLEPDIITLAKGLGGGVPIGAVMTKIKDIFSPGDHGSTFGGNYLVTRASLKVLEILEEFKASGDLGRNIELFESHMERVLEKNSHLIDKIVGVGLMKGFRLKSQESLKRVTDEAFRERVLVLKAGRDTLRLLPPLTITKEEIEVGFERLMLSFSRM
jgi:acetylornithine aminotransferase